MVWHGVAQRLPGTNVWLLAGKHSDIEAAFKRIKAELGPPEVLVYNAAQGSLGWPPPGAGLACQQLAQLPIACT